MYCRRCGANNPDGDLVCSSCGAPLESAPTSPKASKPDNYLVWSILATLCCCLIPGIVAIVYAVQVDSKWAAGDYAGAQAAAANARTWTLVSFVLGLVGGIIITVIRVLSVAAGTASPGY